MKYCIFALIIVCICIFGFCLDMLLHTPSGKPVKFPVGKEEETQNNHCTFGSSIPYWQQKLDIIRQAHPDLSGILEGVPFSNGVLLYDKQNSGKRPTLVFYFHKQKSLFEFLLAYTNCYKEVLPVEYDIYCFMCMHFEKGEPEVIRYFKEHNISMDTCIEDTVGPDTLFMDTRYVCVGVQRPALYVLKTDKKDFLEEQVNTSELFKQNMPVLKSHLSLSGRMRCRMFNSGMAYVTQLEPKLEKYMADCIVKENNTCVLRYQHSLDIEEVLEQSFDGNGELQMLSQQLESKDCSSADIVKKITRIVKEVSDLNTLKVFRKEQLLAENMFKVCIGFTPCTKDMTYPHYQQVEVYVRLCTKEKENVH